MDGKRILTSFSLIILLTILACGQQANTQTPLPTTGSQNISGAVAGTLTAIASQVSSTQTPTLMPATPTITPSDTPTETPTASPTGTFTPTTKPGLHLLMPTAFFLLPTDTLTATPGLLIINNIAKQIVPLKPIFQAQPSKLDYQANPIYGDANLSAGFTPDPYTVGINAGGPVDISYLGGSCSGHASTAPDFRLDLGSAGSLLRIYFISNNGDAAMVVNDPYGNYYCVDDSFGTLNPTIDFNNPAGGSYDIWITAPNANSSLSGTLYLTENAGNHP